MILNGRQIPAAISWGMLVSMVTNDRDVTVTYRNSPGLPSSGTLTEGEMVDDATVLDVRENRE